MVFIQNSSFDWVLKKLYREGIYYQKSGVMLCNLVPEGGQQLDIFIFSDGTERSHKLMETMGKINHKFPQNNVKLALEGTKKSWVMKRGLKTPNYSSDRNDFSITVKPKDLIGYK